MTRTIDNEPIIGSTRRAACRIGLLAMTGYGVGGLTGCGTSLLPKAAPPPALYSLDDAAASDARSPSARSAAPTLVVNPPRAAAGFDTTCIIYLRQPQSIDSYTQSAWVDTPAQMLAPLIVRAVQRSGAFRAVLRGPSAAEAEFLLDTELIRLQHEFMGRPSRVRLTLRAGLIATASRRVLASREFDASAVAPSEDAPGGVTAAHMAVQTLLAELAAFCASAIAD